MKPQRPERLAEHRSFNGFHSRKCGNKGMLMCSLAEVKAAATGLIVR